MGGIFTPERRRQAALRIHDWQPWTRSTGPRTAAGKRRIAQNSYRGGLQLKQRALARELRAITKRLDDLRAELENPDDLSGQPGTPRRKACPPS